MFGRFESIFIYLNITFKVFNYQDIYYYVHKSYITQTEAIDVIKINIALINKRFTVVNRNTHRGRIEDVSGKNCKIIQGLYSKRHKKCQKTLTATSKVGTYIL